MAAGGMAADDRRDSRKAAAGEAQRREHILAGAGKTAARIAHAPVFDIGGRDAGIGERGADVAGMEEIEAVAPEAAMDVDDEGLRRGRRAEVDELQRIGAIREALAGGGSGEGQQVARHVGITIISRFFLGRVGPVARLFGSRFSLKIEREKPMVRFSLFLVCAAACLAQTPKTPKEPPKPPADVDQALRARVQEFFQYHVTGEFRKAEALVAEDTKDLYYNRDKPRYLKFIEIARIDYNPDFTKATATVMVVTPQMIPGWEGGAPTIPIPSTWKIENGKWCWYLEPEAFLRTPFGSIPLNTVSSAAAANPGQLPASLFPAPGPQLNGTTLPAVTPNPVAPNPGVPMAGGQPAPAIAGMDPAALAAIAGAQKLGMSAAGIPGAVPPDAKGKIKPDKEQISLTPGKSGTVTFANTASDGRTLLLLNRLQGIQAKLDRDDVKGGETATLTLEAGKDAKDGILNLVIPQTGEMYSIRVSVK